MAEDREQLSGNGSVQDEVLRQYLLGALGDEVRLRLDERLLVDDEFAQRVSLAESELIDDYTGGRLNAADRNQFVRRFLVTDERRNALRLSAALNAFAGSEPPPRNVMAAKEIRTSWGETFSALFGLRRPGFAFAGAVAILIMVVGLAWFISRGSRQPQPAIASNPSPESPTQRPTPVEPSQALASSQATPDIKPQPKASPAERSVSPAVATFVLLPGALRSGGSTTRIAVPRGEHDVVRLNLILENAGAGPYLAELANANGQTVMVKKDLKPHVNGQTKITLEVPARLIQTNDYQVKLQKKTDGKLESVGRYYFRALPE